MQKRLKAITKRGFALNIAVDPIGRRDESEKIENLNIGVRNPCNDDFVTQVFRQSHGERGLACTHITRQHYISIPMENSVSQCLKGFLMFLSEPQEFWVRTYFEWLLFQIEIRKIHICFRFAEFSGSDYAVSRKPL